MKVRAFLTTAAALTIGYAIAAALYWALLNVPESNVLALALSALLVLLTAVVAGLTTAGGVALIGGGSPGHVWKRALGALPGFFFGVLIFAMLWWVTGWADALWQAHAGEADALLLRYLGTARTSPMHRGISAATWMV